MRLQDARNLISAHACACRLRGRWRSPYGGHDDLAVGQSTVHCLRDVLVVGEEAAVRPLNVGLHVADIEGQVLGTAQLATFREVAHERIAHLLSRTEAPTRSFINAHAVELAAGVEYVARIDLEEVRPVVEDTGRVVVVDFVVQDALTMPVRILMVDE